MKNGTYEVLFNEISKLKVIDTHEHLPFSEENRINDNHDLLSEYLTHYLRSDVISSGLKQSDYQTVMDTSKNIIDRWNIVEPFWEFCRYTGYGRTLDIAVEKIYGVSGINRNTIEEVNSLYLQNKKPGHFERVLHDLCNIEVSLLDVGPYYQLRESPFFKYIWQPPMNYIMPIDYALFSKIKDRYGISVKNLDDFICALETEMAEVVKLHDVRVIKSAIAYMRTLRFEKVDYSEAKDLFAVALNKWENEQKAQNRPPEFPKALQDFMMHRVLKVANELNLTFQIHTGILEGNGAVLSNSNPELLTNLFLEYPNVDFDLFHISYPYQGSACALCKMFPNVYIDMCWAHIISPSASVLALNDFLDAVPYNKISAFGGDYLFVDGVYGHLYISRQNIARSLAEKVRHGVFGENKAVEIAKAMYYDNPKRIFKL